jgi:methionine synthase II (cobalamin-independent)
MFWNKIDQRTRLMFFASCAAGPGVYDVHSPAVPPVDALRAKIKQFVDTGVLEGQPERLWINPDCGLKTRDWVEVRPNPADGATESSQDA